MSTQTSSSPRSFDPAALFLLDLGFENLFEQASADPSIDRPFRCKGCGAIVSRGQREKHYKHHRRVEHGRRARETQRNRERALVKARRARHQTEGRTS